MGWGHDKHDKHQTFQIIFRSDRCLVKKTFQMFVDNHLFIPNVLRLKVKGMFIVEGALS